MPKLIRLPASAPGEPPCWLLELRETPEDDQARAALEELILPQALPKARMIFQPGSAVQSLELELCELCPIMKWRRRSPDTLLVSLQKVTAKAWGELWKLATQGGSEYSFEVLDFTADPTQPVQTYLTLRRVEPSS